PQYAGRGTAESLQATRNQTQPSNQADKPTTFLTINAVVAATDAEARALAVPNMQHMARLRTGQPLGPIDLVEDAAARPISDGEQRIVDAGIERGVVGTPDDSATDITPIADVIESG